MKDNRVMNIAQEIKNSIRAAVHKAAANVNFNFNEIKTVTYPYVFLSLQNLELEAVIDTYFRRVRVLCLLEYGYSDEPKTEDLFAFQDVLSGALFSFDFLNTKISALNQQFSIVEKTLKMSFELDFYVRLEDEGEMMKELNITIGEN